MVLLSSFLHSRFCSWLFWWEVYCFRVPLILVSQAIISLHQKGQQITSATLVIIELSFPHLTWPLIKLFGTCKILDAVSMSEILPIPSQAPNNQSINDDRIKFKFWWSWYRWYSPSCGFIKNITHWISQFPLGPV